jgi:hypothetical protein
MMLDEGYGSTDLSAFLRSQWTFTAASVAVCAKFLTKHPAIP